MKQTEPRARIEELRLSGFRAFENARLKLDDLTVLVGHNGSGKSTLIDALEFVRDALSDSLENALDRRGGLQALQHQGPRSEELSIAIKLRLPLRPWFRRGSSARSPYRQLVMPLDLPELPLVEDAPTRPEIAAIYGFRLAPKRGGLGFVVKDERARLDKMVVPLSGKGKEKHLVYWPAFSLGLPVIAGSHPMLHALLKGLREGIRAYNLSPSAIRAEPPIGRASILSRNGDNAGDVLHHLQRYEKDVDWIVRHLSAVTPGIVGIKASTAAGRRLIQFIQRSGKGSKLRFHVGDMSDGTLRCLAILLALRQDPTPALTCIEEIEDSVHPAALGVLLDAISTSSEQGQILITSHSPEALSHPSVTAERIRIIEWRNGRSQIFQPSPGAHEMSKPPRSVGTLLRTNALFPAKVPERIEGDLFGSP